MRNSSTIPPMTAFSAILLVVFLRLAWPTLAVAQRSVPATGTAQPVTAAQQTHEVQLGPCRAALPPGWELQPGPNGQSADIAGPNGAHVAWGILGVNPAMRRFYGDLYGPPEVHSAAMLSIALGTRARFVSTSQIGGFYTAHEFQAGSAAGVALYHSYPGSAGGYIISEYFAWAPQGDTGLLSQAEAVMTSLSCSSSVRPSEPWTYKPSSGVTDRRRSGGGAESDSLRDYNSTLGTQYAHDSAGNNYLLDRATQWNDTGPDGPGYYVGSGVNREKLTTGLE